MSGVRIAGLYTKTNPQGEQYFEGSFTYGTVIKVFANKYKQKDTQPDYVVYVSQAPQDKDKKAAPQGRIQRPPQSQAQVQQTQPQPAQGPRVPPHKRPGYVDHTKPVEPPAYDSPWPDQEFSGSNDDEPPF